MGLNNKEFMQKELDNFKTNRFLLLWYIFIFINHFYL